MLETNRRRLEQNTELCKLLRVKIMDKENQQKVEQLLITIQDNMNTADDQGGQAAQAKCFKMMDIFNQFYKASRLGDNGILKERERRLKRKRALKKLPY